MPRILFMGTPDFAVAMLAVLLKDGWPIAGVVTQPDRPLGRKRVLTPTPVKVAAQQAGLHVLQPERVRQKEALTQIAALHPEVIVTAAYGQWLPEALLNMPIRGAFNVHASLLPKFRGGAPIQHAIMQGESETGVTIMSMVKAMDAGPMWAKAIVAIGADMTYGELHDELTTAGARLLRSTLPAILSNRITPVEQDPAQATLAPTIGHEDERLDFTRTSREVYNHIRALAPRPGAYTYLRDKRTKIWYATANHDWRGQAEPGQVVGATAEGPLIACATGAVVATQIQVEGKQVQTGIEFVRGQRDLTSLRCCAQKDSDL